MPGGEVVVETFDSRALKGNALGDPTKRDVAIYLPPKYDSTKRYPAAYGIVGYTGTGKMLLGVDPLGEDLTSKLDRLDRKSTRLNSSHRTISYAVFCLKKKKTK